LLADATSSTRLRAAETAAAKKLLRSFALQFYRSACRFAGAAYLGTGALAASAVSILSITHPAIAGTLIAALQTAVTCATKGTTPCVSATNTSSGIGILGASNTGTGVRGKSNTNTGVRGSSKTSYGILGQSTSGTAGVMGNSPNFGVMGTTTGGDVGVWGSGGTGIAGQSRVGLFGTSDSGIAVQAFSDSGIGLRASSNTGTAIVANSTNSDGLEIEHSDSTLTAAVDARGAYIALEGATPPNGTPLLLTSGSGARLFSVDGTGNVFAAGRLISLARTAGGATVAAFSPKTTLPTVEDAGTALLAGGSAVVRLDPTFAATIDSRTGYRVLLTPRGDTRGLSVAAIGPAAFAVRESQGGRTTASFDYRIVATALGQAGQRMTVSRAAAPSASAPFVRSKPPRFAGRAPTLACIKGVVLCFSLLASGALPAPRSSLPACSPVRSPSRSFSVMPMLPQLLPRHRRR
jgi:hypothetical protein